MTWPKRTSFGRFAIIFRRHRHQRRVREGRRVVTDGPFAETREQLGGYFLIEAASLEEAIEVAGRIPGARKGTVEVRPIHELPNLPNA